MGLFSKTPRSIKKLEAQLFATDVGLGMAERMPAENRNRFARETRADLTAAVEAAVREGQASEALTLLDAIDQSKDYVVGDFRWLEFVAELRALAAGTTTPD